VRHEPVLLEKVCSFIDFKEGETVLDGTLGSGGYAKAILERIGTKGRLVGLDRDPEAIERSRKRLEGYSNVFFHQLNYSSFQQAFQEDGVPECNRMVLDLGLSRDQLLDPHRGFSFMSEGPLDMRMDSREGVLTAGDLVASLSESDLADLIYKLGEERFSRRIARRIVAERKQKPIQSTKELAEVVSRAVPRRHSRIHPATRTFQALRMAVNDELGHLDRFLEKFPESLSSKGRCGIVTFHSLEDRKVKHRFRELAGTGEFALVNKKVERPDREEVLRNPASRSAKLRVIEKK